MSAPLETSPKNAVSPDELIARARALLPNLLDRQERTEAERRVSDEAFEEFFDAELHKILLPARYGGFEHGLDTFADVAFEIARGCGSTGWVCSVANSYPLVICKFSAEAQDEVWRDNPRAMAAASIVPKGAAVAVDGGVRLSGNWPYCSGIDNSSWMIVTANVVPGDGAEPTEKGFALVPKADFHIEDNWHAMGLAGTGSKDAACEDLLVPTHRFLPVSDVVSGDTPGSGIHAGDVYKIPMFAGFSVGVCAPVMGMARGALDEFMGATLGRDTRGAALSNPVSMADIPAIQLHVAEAFAAVDAAKMLVDRDCRDIMATMARGELLTVEQRARNKGDLGFATRLAKQAVDHLFEASGGGGLLNRNRVQRFWRDVHAGALHISLKWEAVGVLYGRVMLGLPPGPAQF